MITLIIIVLHSIICILLIAIILVQSGRGGGLVESFSGVESMFGTKTSSFLTRATTILSITFFITCLSLAFLSAQQSRSLMRDIRIPQENKAETESIDTTQAETLEGEQTAMPAETQTETPHTEPESTIPASQ